MTSSVRFSYAARFRQRAAQLIEEARSAHPDQAPQLLRLASEYSRLADEYERPADKEGEPD